jgi:uncharacterized OB-fold protein
MSAVAYYRNNAQRREQLASSGHVKFLTQVNSGGESPYLLAVIESTDGKKMLGKIVDTAVADLVIGQGVVAVVRRDNVSPDGFIAYGIKFRPA